MGVTKEELKGQPAIKFVPKKDQDFVQSKILEVFKTGNTEVEIPLKIANGNTAFYHIVANRFSQEGKVFCVGSGVDVTQKKELEQEINNLLQKEHKQRLKAEDDRDKLKEMLEMTPSPKCLLEGPDLTYALANKAYREVIGQDNIIGKRVVDVVPEIEEQGIIDILNNV